MLTEWSPDSGVSREDHFGSSQYSSIKGLDYQDMLAMDVQRGRDHGMFLYIWVIIGLSQMDIFCHNEYF